MEPEAVSGAQARGRPGLGALERRIERHPTAMRGAPFGPSPQTPLPPHDGRAPQAGRLTEACCRFRLGASTRAQPPLQHHSDGDPTWRPDHDLPVEGKDDGRGYEGRVFRPLLSGRTYSNAAHDTSGPALACNLLLSASLRCDRCAMHSAVPSVFELRDYAQPLRRNL